MLILKFLQKSKEFQDTLDKFNEFRNLLAK